MKQKVNQQNYKAENLQNHKIKQNVVATGKIYLKTLKAGSNNFFVLKIRQLNTEMLLKW